MTKKARLYNDKKTASSINYVENTEQPHAKEENWATFLHHIQK